MKNTLNVTVPARGTDWESIRFGVKYRVKDVRFGTPCGGQPNDLFVFWEEPASHDNLYTFLENYRPFSGQEPGQTWRGKGGTAKIVDKTNYGAITYELTTRNVVSAQAFREAFPELVEP